MTIRIAFAGCGYIARIHARAARQVGAFSLDAVVNHKTESMSAFAAEFDIPEQHSSIESLLAGEQIDALVICTPNFLHAPQAIAALQAGLHVMVEKPMAMNAAEARAMQQASQDAGLKLMVAHCWRFDEEVLWLKERIDNGRLGKIIRTQGYGVHTNWGPAGWFTRPELAGSGALADMGIHALDTARFLLGDPRPLSVYARLGTFYRELEVDDTGLILVNWDNGASSCLESGWWQPHADGPEAATRVYAQQGYGSVFPTHLKLTGPLPESIDPGFTHPRQEHCPPGMYERQLAYFADCILQDRSPDPGGEAGLVNMQIIDAALQSSRSGEVVRF